MFITFEAGEKAGKTTQLKLLEERLINEGKKVATFYEPGSTLWGEELRTAIKYRNNEFKFDNIDRLFGMTWSRKLLVPLIEEKLGQGNIVLCDRFGDSTTVYQGIVGGLGIERTEQFVKEWATHELKPNITFYIDLTVDEAMKRKQKDMNDEKNFKDFFDMQPVEYHDKVRQGYLELVMKYHRIKLIDGNDTPQRVHNQIYNKIKHLLD